jgi:tRNA pseudouridine55 synthase
MDGILLVDKARGGTSHDVVGRARRALGQRDVGHAGTLDPMATVRFGVETDTLDADGVEVARREGPAPSEAAVREAVASMVCQM